MHQECKLVLQLQLICSIVREVFPPKVAGQEYTVRRLKRDGIMYEPNRAFQIIREVSNLLPDEKKWKETLLLI